jgi:hypothetical protein
LGIGAPASDLRDDLIIQGGDLFLQEVVPAFLRLVTHPAFSLQSLDEAHEQIMAAPLVEGLATHIADLHACGLVAPVDAQTAAQAFIAAIHSLAILPPCRVCRRSTITFPQSRHLWQYSGAG